MRPVGSVLHRLMLSGQTLTLARQTVAARARRSMLLEELQETRREQQADELEAALPAGGTPHVARSGSPQYWSLACEQRPFGQAVPAATCS